MFALSIRQPWAHLIVHGEKRIENRAWRPADHHLGRRFAIHASKVVDREGVAEVLVHGDDMPLTFVTGAIIGTAVLQGLVDDWSVVPQDQRKWFVGPVGLVLRDVVALAEPIPCRGLLSLWPLPDEIASRL